MRKRIFLITVIVMMTINQGDSQTNMKTMSDKVIEKTRVVNCSIDTVW
jgi:hypothetical protein